MKYLPEKQTFQIRYAPKLSFYDKLYADSELFTHFKDWKTDRLKITLCNVEEMDSIVIAHNSASYDTDKYSGDRAEEAINLLVSNISDFVEESTFERVGLRGFYLYPVEMSMSDLVDIINLRFFAPKLCNAFGQITDSTIDIDCKDDAFCFKIQMGPMKRAEIPRFIKRNVDNHLPADTFKRTEAFQQLFSSLPEVSLYMDIEVFKDTDVSLEAVNQFVKVAQARALQMVKSLVSLVLKKKVS